MEPLRNERSSGAASASSRNDSAARVGGALPPDLDLSIDRARKYLLSRQHEEGYWCGELQGDTVYESEFVLLLAWLNQLDRPVAEKAARYVAAQQLPQGGWPLYPGGELDLNASVKAYFALKLTGYDPRSEPMRLAREAIVAHGGADGINSWTRFYLALLGQIPFDYCPAVLPETVLLPAWSPLNVYRVSAWSRVMLIPLSIVWAHRPVRPLSRELGIDELFVRPVERWPESHCPGMSSSGRVIGWDRLFRTADRLLKVLERFRVRPLRRRALSAAKRWMTDRFVDSDGLGAHFAPIVWSVVALKCLGYCDQSAEVRYCHEQLEDLMIEEGDSLRIQPCKSPVWDTALTLRALATVSEPGDERVVAAATSWLLSREVTRPGDWSAYVEVEPSGWSPEYHNVFYPDLHNTATVVAALREQFLPDCDVVKSHGSGLAVRSVAANMDEARERSLLLSRAVDACERARRWILAMQNQDGGWGALDKDNDRKFLCHLPYADHNAMIDPSSPDLTGRVLAALAGCGATLDDPAVRHAVGYLRRTQEADGSWCGRWGVNHIYGTWQCLVGLSEAGVKVGDECLQRGAAWLLAHQQSSGGWGESPESYVNAQFRGQGLATPSQTSWALLGLLACGLHEHPAVRRGVDFLVTRQRPDGSWLEEEFTGTRFPRVAYLRHQMYPWYFPLLALGRYHQAQRGAWRD